MNEILSKVPIRFKTSPPKYIFHAELEINEDDTSDLSFTMPSDYSERDILLNELEKWGFNVSALRTGNTNVPPLTIAVTEESKGE